MAEAASASNGNGNGNDAKAPPFTNEYENLWESAANDRYWNANEETTGLQRSPAAATTETNEDYEPAPSCYFQCFQVCHWLDILGGTAVWLYTGLVLLRNHSKDNLQWLTQWFLMGLATTWLLRGVLAMITKCGVRISATISLTLSILYALLALLAWMLPPVTQKDELLAAHWMEDNSQWIPLFLLTLSVLELARWAWIRHWMESEAVLQDRDGYSNSQARPWWRQRPSTTAREPLLQPHWSTSNSTGYHMEDGVSALNTSGVSSQTNGWWPFGRTTHNPRDDGSVDYASLQEDWASRSEEDPYWWSREDE